MSRDKCLQTVNHRFKTAISKPILLCALSSTVWPTNLLFNRTTLWKLLFVNISLLVDSIPFPPVLKYA